MESLIKKVVLNDGGTHFFLPAMVDKIPANFLIDTGAMFTILADRFINHSTEFRKHKRMESCTVEGLSGTEEAEVIHIGCLAVAGWEFTASYAVVNLSNIDSYYVSEGSPFLIDGILGNDLLIKIGFWDSFKHPFSGESR